MQTYDVTIRRIDEITYRVNAENKIAAVSEYPDCGIEIKNEPCADEVVTIHKIGEMDEKRKKITKR